MPVLNYCWDGHFSIYKNASKWEFVIEKLTVSRGGIKPPTQGFSGLVFLLDRIKISAIFPPEVCGNNSIYQLYQKRWFMEYQLY